VLIPVSAYAMVGLTVAGWAIAQNQWPRVVAAAAAWIAPWLA